MFGPEVGVFLLIVFVIGCFRWMPVARLVRAQSSRCAKGVRRSRTRAWCFGAAPGRTTHPAQLARAGDRGRHDRCRGDHRRVDAVIPRPWLSAGYPDLGRILYDSKDYLDIAAHWALFPGAAIFLTVLTINFIGDGLRDALDPRKVL